MTGRGRDRIGPRHGRADESVSKQWVVGNISLAAPTAKQVLVDQFETMGELAAWVLYAKTLTDRPHIGETTTERLRGGRDVFIRCSAARSTFPSVMTTSRRWRRLSRAESLTA